MGGWSGHRIVFFLRRFAAAGIVTAGLAAPGVATTMGPLVVEEPITTPPGMVYMPPGRFMMGSPDDELGRKPDEHLHEVTLTHGFFIGIHEVTQGEWVLVMGENPSYFSDCGPDCPVDQVTWYDAIQYCNARSILEGLTPAYTISGDSVRWKRWADGYRLPTEAEWEYACRASTSTAFYNGDITNEYEDPLCDRIAWYYYNSGYESHPWGLKDPNPAGMYDLGGNVYEWCWDWYTPHLTGPAVDPTGPPTGVRRSWRGGSWYNQARYCRSAYRQSYEPDRMRYNLGFRVARTYKP